MNLRFRLVWFVFFAGFLLVLGRLFYWQVVKAKDLSIQARKQYQTGESMSAPRGNIFADDGSILAGRDDGWTVYAYLPEVTADKNKIADQLAPLLAEEPEEGEDPLKPVLNEASHIKELLANTDLSWIPLKRKVATDIKKNIESFGFDGIGFESADLRIYPEASSAAQMLGFVGKNEEGSDQGYFGLEGFYDLILSGKPGYMSRDTDARGSPILIGDLKEVSAVKGIDLVTNINKGIQIDIEKKLKDGIEKYSAKAGTVIVMEPRSGAIVAMASYPSYDPAEYAEYTNDLFKNPAISDSFEPGSVFKVVVMASALDADVIEPDTKCDICGEALKVDKYYIETWNNKYHPDATMTEVIVNSDNVGMAFVGQKLGADKFYDYVKAFGFGEISGIDLEGESSPEIRKKGTWNIVDLATASFGQGIAVTPVQIVRAVGAIANDGILVKPTVAKKLVQDAWSEEIKPQETGRAVSKEVADNITNMMVEAAKSGESKWTYLRGFGVAGKTGTAQIPIAGHYDAKNTIASFVGFAPYDNPKFVMLVTLREPQSSQWASETAAPLWYSIAKDLFLYYGMQPKD